MATKCHRYAIGGHEIPLLRDHIPNHGAGDRLAQFHKLRSSAILKPRAQARGTTTRKSRITNHKVMALTNRRLHLFDRNTIPTLTPVE